MPAKPFQVAAVSAVIVDAIKFVRVLFHAVVGRVSVHEAVGCDQVDDIAAVVGADLPGCPWAQLVGMRQLLVASSEDNVERARRRSPEIEVDEQVIRAVAPLDPSDPDPVGIDARRVSGNILALHDQLQFRMHESGPPEWRLDALDRCRHDDRADDKKQ